MTNRQKYDTSIRNLNKRTSSGFTFIETLIVFLLLGIVTMLALPSLNGAVNDYRLAGAAGEVVTALEFAQMTAISTGRQPRVTIDDATDTILVAQRTIVADFTQDILSETDVEGGAYAAMDNPLNRGTDYTINLSNEDRFTGVDITGVDFSGGNSVIFDTLGAPSSGGTVTLTCGSLQVVVTVEALNGKVTVS